MGRLPGPTILKRANYYGNWTWAVGRNISSPVADESMLYLGNEERQGTGGTLFAVKAGSVGDITPAEGDSTSSGVIWSVEKSGLAMSSPLLCNGYIYIVERRRGAISCYEALSGCRYIRVSGSRMQAPFGPHAMGFG